MLLWQEDQYIHSDVSFTVATSQHLANRLYNNQSSITSFVVFFLSGALKYQTNIEAHPPGCLRANQSSPEQPVEDLEQGEDEESRCREEAHFQPHYPQVWVCVAEAHLLCLCMYLHLGWKEC